MAEHKELAIWILLGGATVAILLAIWAVRGSAVRYLLAMVFAAAAAFAATLFISAPVASYVTGHLRFDSPDGAADVHMFTFLGTSVAALMGGWMLGWVLAGPLANRRRP